MSSPGAGSLAGGLMVCGTGSDSGKSTFVAGLCRLLARRGLKVAPFKAQNMALNSVVTAAGQEMGRAQAAQARAAGVDPESAMNPVLLKPTDHRRSQVVVEGRPWATLDAVSYQAAKEQLWPVVVRSLLDLRRRFDVVVCEGAGSPAEINLLAHDITNLRVAAEAGFASVLVGDIDRGGVFAALYGTVAVLPPELSGLVRAFVINKFRGDPQLLGPGLAELEARTGVPTIGVLPWLEDLGIDAEDSLGLSRRPQPRAAAPGPVLDVAVVALPRISNFTDLDPLAVEGAVRVRMVDDARGLGTPDLVVLPGSKSTVSDLDWLRRCGLAGALSRLADRGGATTVLGICGGYQMLGRTIDDAVESSRPATVTGLGLLPVDTVFDADKVTRRVQGRALGEPVGGYEIHHGRIVPAEPWIETTDGPEGSWPPGGAVVGTTIHGLFENDRFRRRFLAEVAARAGVSWEPGPPVCFEDARDAQTDLLADTLEEHIDMEAVEALIKAGAS